MWKKRRKRIVSVTASVTTGILIACIVWYGLTIILSGQSLKDAQIPYLTMPRALLLGILCGVETEFIMPGEERPPKECWLRYLLHYVAVTATALVCGYFYGWYDPTILDIFLMCLTSVGIYAFASYLKFRSGKKVADEMNACLEEIRKNGKNDH